MRNLLGSEAISANPFCDATRDSGGATDLVMLRTDLGSLLRCTIPFKCVFLTFLATNAALVSLRLLCSEISPLIDVSSIVDKPTLTNIELSDSKITNRKDEIRDMALLPLVDAADSISEHVSSLQQTVNRQDDFNETKSSSENSSSTSQHNISTTLVDSRIIYYLHIHKAGGSTMCQAARHNGVPASYKTNCLVTDDQTCCGQNDSIQSLALFAKNTSYKFVSNEKDMYRNMDHEHYRYLVTLRESEARYKSHWQFNIRHHIGGEGTFSSWWQRQPDNWTTRKLCGKLCGDIPKFQLNKTLFQDAVDRLLQFDNIVFLEYFSESYKKFAEEVLWKPTLPFVATNVANSSSAAYPPLGDSWDPLMTSLDDVLYEIALNVRFFQNASNASTLSEEAVQKLEF